jgi:beta-phosphoglucomutase-like phosphatase (HAD superfamily)/ribosomal protein S18 acetylase RimI-like enzyme
MMNAITIRPLTVADAPILRDILYEAIYVPDDQPRPSRDIVDHPSLAMYVQNWGRPDDAGVVAVDSERHEVVGAAWFRRFPKDAPGYGFVEINTPELSIALLPQYRGQGIGSRLLTQLLEIARAQYAAISLSVDSNNPALRLYQRAGFERVGMYGTSLIMLRRFSEETYRGMIFDFNGVLLWDTELQEDAWKSYSAELRGTPLKPEEIRQYVHGRPNRVTLEYVLGRQLSGKEADRLSQEKERVYRQMCLAWGDGFILSPGSQEFLDRLTEHRIPRTIATASEQHNVRFFVKHLQLERWFDVENIVMDDGTFPGKPAPDIYLRAAMSLGLSPSECVVVEDSISGLQAACRAGIGRIYALGPKAEHTRLASLEGIHKAICRVSEIPISIFYI